MVDEIELKFKVKDYERVIEKIREIAKHVSSAYEQTIMFDDRDKSLFKKDARLRLRKIKDLTSNKEGGELSYKKPKTREEVKVEEEYKTPVDFEETKRIIENIGFRKVSSYERIRDKFRMEGAEIVIDSFPFGDFVEIEGEIEKIKNIASRLGFDMKDNITKSCDDIYADLCKIEGKAVRDDIIFEKSQLTKTIEKRHILR